MPDVHNRKTRSYNMSRIRAKNTKPELAVRSMLHRLGYRFRLENKLLPGKPDIILPKYKTVIFVHGCFWHRHIGCQYSSNPKSRRKFWQKKFQSNVERDQKVSKLIKDMGWKQIVIWECEAKDREILRTKIEAAL